MSSGSGLAFENLSYKETMCGDMKGQMATGRCRGGVEVSMYRGGNALRGVGRWGGFGKALGEV